MASRGARCEHRRDVPVDADELRETMLVMRDRRLQSAADVEHGCTPFGRTAEDLDEAAERDAEELAVGAVEKRLRAAKCASCETQGPHRGMNAAPVEQCRRCSMRSW